MTHRARVPASTMVRLLALSMLIACQRTPVTTGASPASLPRIPRDAARFEIDSVTDSTVIFRTREARWVRRGHVAYAVDPMQRDALIAQLRIVSRDSLSATAVVTAQASGLRVSHALLVVQPPTPWWKRGLFWSGTGVGAALGAGVTVLAR